MFGKKKRAPEPRGAAAARQMGLLVDLDPDQLLLGADDSLDDLELEAELAALTGNPPGGGGGQRAQQPGRGPLPMEDIARMAVECMRDVDEDEEDETVDDDEDLLAELQEVVGEGEREEAAPSSQATLAEPPLPQVSSAAPGSLQHTLETRTDMYRTAAHNARSAGETAKARRFDRGLKTLDAMLAAVRKGRPVDEAEIPPPVAAGATGASCRPAAPHRPPPPAPMLPETTPHDEWESPASSPPPPVPQIIAPGGEEEEELSPPAAPPTPSSPPAPQQTDECHGSTSSRQTDASGETLTLLSERQKEYKMAALRAKKQGDVEQAKIYYKTSKTLDSVMEALKGGQAVDLSGLPPPPGESKGQIPGGHLVMTEGLNVVAPQAPRDVLEALEQRRAKYLEASAQAKASGDDRKARMHERIAKQYQSAIRSHKAGKSVSVDELPVPPGFPPIPGQKAAEQGLMAALEAADRLTSTDSHLEKEEEEEERTGEESKAAAAEGPSQPLLDVPSAGLGRIRSPSASPERTSSAAQQLDFLEGRRKQYMKAALQAKQKKDLEQAKAFLRTAKSLEPLMEAVRGGRPVDIRTVPSPPGDEDEDFILVHHSDVQMSENAEQVYTQLAQLLKEQHEKCLTHSKQFAHLGNVGETMRFENMAEACRSSLSVLKSCQSRGLPAPRHHFEERSFTTVRMFPELSSSEMQVSVVRAMNLSSPGGVHSSDLDAYVKLDFPYPSSEQPQRHRTSVVKNTNSPEFNQTFSLTINRNHRGFRRLLTSKGLKLELLHRGGFLRSDKPIGSAHVKLEKLETQSEIREIAEVMDGRRSTGGRVEVKVRLREPLSGQDVQTSTQRWLVIEPTQVL